MPSAKLSPAQIDLLKWAARPDTLLVTVPASGFWWVWKDTGINAATAKALLKKGYIKPCYSQLDRLDFFCISEAGHAALKSAP